MSELVSLLAVTLVAGATLAIGAFGLRVSRTTSDFFVASRRVGPFLNASAISGEYLSAASFLGIAGLVMKSGVSVNPMPASSSSRSMTLLLTRQ